MMAELTHRHYRRPPILEAVAEFHFLESPEWDLTVPGKFYDIVRSRYPGKPRKQAAVAAQVQADADGRSLRFTEGPARVQFPTVDDSRFLAIAPDVLSVHIKSPYQGWDEDFRPRIAEALAAYQQVASPARLRRVGVRYVNRISIEGTTVTLEDYFNIAPRRADGLPAALLNFISRMELKCDAPDTKLLVTFGQLPSGPEDTTIRYVLDLDAIWESEAPRDTSAALETADILKSVERSAFEAVITDSLREAFNA